MLLPNLNREIVLTFLGTGTSQGVPVIGCRCPVCTSTDSKDKRLRTSAMIETSGKRFIIDAGPDFRMQMLREGVDSITAILLTHFHKDHIGGIDDVRALNYVNYPQRIQNIDIYAKKDTIECVRKDYDYAFSNVRYRGVPLISLHEIPSSSFTIEGVEIIPIQGTHSIFSVTGFRIGPIAYLTDFKSIAETEVEKLKGVSTLVVNALRFSSHDSHFSVSEALELISRVSPQKAYLTHMSHEIGTHTWASERLPENVYFAYDTLKVFNYF